MSIVLQNVLYCGVCSYPPEFCEFGGSFKKCKEWLQTNEPTVFSQLYSDEALANATSSLSIDREEKIHKDLEKLQRKEEAKQERELQLKLSSKVLIKRIERTKRKHVIAISGLEVFDIEPKKLAKTLLTRFATGASVTKNAEKKNEIIIQGDVADECEEYITKLLLEKGLTDVKVEQLEDKKKKKALL